MSNSLLSLRSRKASQARGLPSLPAKRLHIQAFKDQSTVPTRDDPVLPVLGFIWFQEYTFFEKKTKVLRDYDRALLGFRYGEALDLVLRNGDNILVKTLLTELKHRAALPQAMHNRNPETLLPILQWMQKNFNDPRYTGIIIDAMYEILGIYPLSMLFWR